LSWIRRDDRGYLVWLVDEVVREHGGHLVVRNGSHEPHGVLTGSARWT
jgi:hypothetical protein